MNTIELAAMVSNLNSVDYWRKKCEKQQLEINGLESRISTLEIKIEENKDAVREAQEILEDRKKLKDIKIYRQMVDDIEQVFCKYGIEV